MRADARARSLTSGRGAFDTIGGEVVSTAAFVLANRSATTSDGSYSSSSTVTSETAGEGSRAARMPVDAIATEHFDAELQRSRDSRSPVAYWLSERRCSRHSRRRPRLASVAESREGLDDR